MSSLILIVDDWEDDSFLLERMLRRLRVSNPILKLNNGDEALAYLSGEGKYSDRQQFPIPSVLFLDLLLPGKSGFDILHWIQKHPFPEKCLLMVVSDLHALGDINRAYQLGANSFLGKPLNDAELRECLRNHPHCWLFGNSIAEP